MNNNTQRLLNVITNLSKMEGAQLIAILFPNHEPYLKAHLARKWDNYGSHKSLGRFFSQLDLEHQKTVSNFIHTETENNNSPYGNL